MYTLELQDPQCTLESEQPFEGTPRVAILASQNADRLAITFAGQLGRELGKAGAIVVAGSDSLAEQSALAGACSSRRAWLVTMSGVPEDAVRLRAEVSRTEGALIRATMARSTHIERAPREIACALASVIVVVQSSSHRCPTLRAATMAFDVQKKRVWVVPPSPWFGPAEGSLILVRRPGIRSLWRSCDLLSSLGLAKATPLVRRDDPSEQRIVEALTMPLSKDRLMQMTELNCSQLATAMFNLMVDGVVRETLDGRVELVL